MPPAPKRKPIDDPTAADPDKNARLETYEQEAPPLERLVDAHPDKKRK
jgi:hypothetical protein